MDKQTIFNTIARHLLTQNSRSMRSPFESICSYRSQDRKKCAIGAIIKDEYYTSKFDMFGYSVDDNEVLSAVALSLGTTLVDLDSKFLRELQTIHDLNDVGYWPDLLESFAQTNTLNADVLKEFKDAAK